AEGVTHADPCAQRCARAAKLLGDGTDAGGRAEGAIRSGEEVLSEDPEVIVAPVEQVVDAGKDLEVGTRPVVRVEIHQGVAGQLAVDVLVVLIAARVDSVAHQNVHAYVELSRELVAETHLEDLARQAGDAVARLDLDGPVRVCTGVVRASLQERRLEGRIREAVARGDRERAQAPITGQLESPTAGCADV